MCGIAGWLGVMPDARSQANRIAESLRHRGPDARGIRDWHDAALIHTRLSIIDLSPAGAQPMANEDGTVWTAFNGEVYNHKELRRSLEAHGHTFKGRSDSEVIPHLYEERGAGFVDLLRGMFALAVYDSRSRTLILARDRFGIKPLFYSVNTKRLVFASEIRALLQLPEVDTRPDGQAIHDLAALFYIPAPGTFYRGIRSLEPGELIEASLGSNGLNLTSRRFHRWTISREPRETFAQAVVKANALVATAVQRQSESDVPLGALLSGGIDSSLVASAAQGALHGELRTFNVKFSEEDYDETWAADAVAKHIGSRHEILEMADGQGTWENITALLLHAGQPFADPSLFAVNAICRAMRERVAVALSGDGGDEGFSGYGIYWRLARIAQCQRVPAPFWHVAAASLTPLVWFNAVPSWWAARLQNVAGADDVAVVQDLFSLLPQNQHRELCQLKNVLPVRRLFEPQWEYHMPPRVSRTERLAAFATEINTRLTLANDFLFKVDLASMRESLEVRVPMLDEDLFEFGISLPYAFNVKGRICKRVLREVARRRLPPTIAHKPKQGFGIPVDSWVDSDFKRRLRHTVLGPQSRLPDFFQPDFYRPRIEAFCESRPHEGGSRDQLYRMAIMLLALQLALEPNGCSSGAGARAGLAAPCGSEPELSPSSLN
jgi:asparagine synthase (glutamine-hydrolysing)